MVREVVTVPPADANRKPDELVAFLLASKHPLETRRTSMNILTSAPVAPLLARLFEEADASSPMNSPAFASMSNEERYRLMRSKADYRELYANLKAFAIPVSPRDGQAALCAGARGAGPAPSSSSAPSFGISTLHLAAALAGERRRAADHRRARAFQGGSSQAEPDRGRFWPTSSSFGKATPLRPLASGPARDGGSASARWREIPVPRRARSGPRAGSGPGP